MAALLRCSAEPTPAHCTPEHPDCFPLTFQSGVGGFLYVLHGAAGALAAPGAVQLLLYLLPGWWAGRGENRQWMVWGGGFPSPGGLWERSQSCCKQGQLPRLGTPSLPPRCPA